MVQKWYVSGVDASLWRVQRGALWRPSVTVRRQVVEVPGRHGSLSTRRPPVFDEPTLSLRFAPLHSSQVDLEDAVNELTAILSGPDVSVRRVSGGVDVSAGVELVSIANEKPGPIPYASVDAVFSVPGVFFRGPVSVSGEVSVSHGAVVSVAHLAVGSGPVGDAVLRFRGPLTSVEVSDVATGTGISWEGSLTGDQYLYLHPGSLTARRSASSSAWVAGGTDVTGGVDYPPVGVLQAWPTVVDVAEPGVRDVRLRVEGNGFGGSSSLVVRGAPAYL